MIYRKRDLRAADFGALVLVGIGTFCSVLVVLGLFGPAEDVKPEVRWRAFSLLAPAVVWLASGFALHAKVKELIRTGGREVEDYEGVPE